MRLRKGSFFSISHGQVDFYINHHIHSWECVVLQTENVKLRTVPQSSCFIRTQVTGECHLHGQVVVTVLIVIRVQCLIQKFETQNVLKSKSF